MSKLFSNRWLRSLAILVLIIACDDEEKAKPAIASFQFEQSETDFRVVTFTNFSQNAVSYSWDFGDDSALSTEESPEHTFETGGTYIVTLTAKGAGGDESVKEEEITITDPNLELKKLTGETSKSWKLIRDVSTGNFPFAVGPQDRSQIWYALGQNEALGLRPCLLNDEYIFSLNGAYEYKTNGDFWAEGGVWNTSVGAPGCLDNLDANFINTAGADISAWNDGIHSFTYDVAGKTVTVNGLGAFVGLAKVATSAEVSVPQQSVTYKVVKLVDGVVDTLILETTLPNPGYWRFVLVHYDNPLQEPEIPGAPPAAGFSYAVDNGTRAVTFTNTSSGAVSYSWNFGDGASSTDENPIHTYTSNGVYTVVLTATNATGDATSTQDIAVGAADLTLADLHGGTSRTWKLKPAAGAFRVGPAKGSGEWFASSADDVTNRACMFDDEFKFSSTLNYTYDSKGQVYGEPFMGVNPNACVNDANLTGVYTGLGSNSTHTFELISSTSTEPVKVKVTGTGAFIGFAKGYNGGEYNGTDTALQTSVTYDVVSFVNDGGVLTLDVSVPINAEKTAWWTVTIVSQ